MAKYTIKLGEILKNILLTKDKSASEIVNINSYECNKTPFEIIEETRTSFFDFDYGIVPEHKVEFEKKFLAHYFEWEIGVQTIAYFKMLLRNALTEQAPYFNKLYQATDSDFSPFDDVDITEVIHGAGTNEAKSTSNNAMHSHSDDSYDGSHDTEIKTSDTPQGRIEDVKAGNYMSNYENNVGTEENTRENTTDGTNNTSNESNGKYDDNRTRNYKGTNGNKSKSQLLVEYRNAIMNIDLMFIEKLQDLFMQIFD